MNNAKIIRMHEDIKQNKIVFSMPKDIKKSGKYVPKKLIIITKKIKKEV